MDDGDDGDRRFHQETRPPTRTGCKLAENKLKLCIIVLNTGEPWTQDDARTLVQGSSRDEG
jgi:hypothetical protein